MNSRYYRLQALILVAALAASCKDDPTASLAGGPAGVELEFNLRKLLVDDSVLAVAVVRDALGTPLALVPAFTSRSTSVATVAVRGLTEVRQTQFFVKGIDFGSTWVVATAGNLSDSMQVQTFPASVEVQGPVGATSGQALAYSFTYRSASGRDLTPQVPAAVWSSGADAVAAVDATSGQATFKDFGSVDVIATGPGLDAIATGPDVEPEDTLGVRGRVTVLVSPAAFGGTVSGVLEPGGIAKILPDAGQPFDADTRVFLNRVQLGTSSGANGGEGVRQVTADSITLRLNNLRATGPYELVLSRVGASQLSVGGDSITLTSGAFSAEGGTITPASLDPGAVVTLTAGTIPFDANSRVFFNGTQQTTDTPSVARTVRLPDLAAGGARSVLITRLGPNDNARTGTFTLNTPATFGGSVTPTGSPAQLVTAVRSAGDPVFDGDVRAFFNGERTFVHQSLGDTAKVVVAPLGFVSGPVELLMTRIGAADNARTSPFTLVQPAGNFFNDPFDVAGNDFDDVATAPEITQDGDYYIVLHGACAVGAGGADCDDLFKIRNTSLVTGDSVTVELDWFTGADVDILWCNAGCTAFRGNFAGATGDNPEASTVVIPANTEWRLWLNLFDAGGAAATLVRVRVTGKN